MPFLIVKHEGLVFLSEVFFEKSYCRQRYISTRPKGTSFKTKKILWCEDFAELE